MAPGALAEILKKLPFSADERVLSGLAHPDDAGVVRLHEDLALVFSADFFPPHIDDAYAYGRIAAANSISDIYAMGGAPLMALNLLSFPKGVMPLEAVAEILRGGLEAANEAGCLVVGGHSMDEAEPRYGLAVVGTVHPDRICTKGGARAGDCLVLTKPLGTGPISMAIKAGVADPDCVRVMIDSATALNKAAMEAALAAGVRAMTDVTGFGLLGHLGEMLEASGVSAEINLGALPQLPGALKLIERGMVVCAAHANLQHLGTRLERRAGISEDLVFLAADPQTSGGLLIAVAEENLSGLLSGLAERQAKGWVVGRITAGREGRIILA